MMENDEESPPSPHEEELELGLSLGAKRVTGDKKKAGTWGDFGGGGCRRILTAKDFPSACGSRASPVTSSSSVSSSEGAKPQSQVVVGWPPIRAFRINSLVNQAKDNTSDSEATTNEKSNNQNLNNKTEYINSNSEENKLKNVGTTRFVKVNMDGDPIGRKVDLNAHQSYKALALALEIMFHKPTIGLSSSANSAKTSKLLDGSSEFALTYEDKDGDWMLVGDVPWGMFLDTVKRLRIMRTSDANGLSPRFQPSTGGLLRRQTA